MMFGRFNGGMMTVSAAGAMVFWAIIAGAAVDEKQRSDPPPLPLHGIEGMGGIFSTYSAHLTNPAREGELFGLPSIGFGYVDIGHGRYMLPLTITETFKDRVELGFAWDYFQLGDLPDDIEEASSIRIGEHHVNLFNINLRCALIREGEWNHPWMPAFTFGVHYKYNDTINDIDRELNGHLKAIGIDNNEDIELTLYMSKMFKDFIRPVMIDLGVRATRAAHLGLLGFTDDYQILPEGNVVVFVTDRLALAAEYRFKPDGYADDLAPLVHAEDDWWTLCGAYVLSDNLTISGGYGHFGNILNHEANASWGIKTKWEF
jgi:hypothetical protein